MSELDQMKGPRAATQGPNPDEGSAEGKEASGTSFLAKHAGGNEKISAPQGSFNDDDPGRPKWDQRTETLAEFDYYHADGRYSSTRVKGRNPDGQKPWTTRRKNTIPFKDRLDPEDKKEWFSGQGDEPLLLFRLPELVKATQTLGVQVLVVEGEKDVETARGLGFAATCNPNGALKWRDEFPESRSEKNLVCG